MAKKNAEELYAGTEKAWRKFQRGKDMTEEEVALLKRMHDTYKRLNEIFLPKVTRRIREQNKEITDLYES